MVSVPRSPTLKLPRIGCYGYYSSDNYGFHSISVDFGEFIIWFSYGTPVAFQVEGHRRVVHENIWSKTTGKHLNWIDGGDKRSRVGSEEFQRLWTEQAGPLLDAESNGRSESNGDSHPGNGEPVETTGKRKLLQLPTLN